MIYIAIYIKKQNSLIGDLYFFWYTFAKKKMYI